MDDEVVSLVVVHRHGARLPTYGYQGDLSYPSPDCLSGSTSFWSKNREFLLPRGCKQLRSVGKQLRLQYSRLFQTVENVKIYSTNTQRTIMSCISLIEGAFPGVSYNLAYINDVRPETYTNSIKILVEEDKEKDVFFYVGNGEDELKKTRNNNLHNSNEIKDYAFSEQAIKLLDKIYEAVEDKSFSPERNKIDRFCELHQLLERHKISQSSGFSFLSNEKDIKFTSEELYLLEFYSQIISSYQFRPGSNKTEDEYGSMVAGFLLSHICEFLLDDNNNGVNIYSAHDTTLLAISSMLGWVIPCPEFASYYLFEKTLSGHLRIKFNYEPDKVHIKHLLPLSWKERKQYVLYDWKYGVTSLEDFCKKFLSHDYCILRNFLKTFCCKGESILSKNLSNTGIELFSQLSPRRNKGIDYTEFSKMCKRIGTKCGQEETTFVFNKFSNGEIMSYQQFEDMCNFANRLQ